MTQPTPPGWYPDPSGAPGTRYWDGNQWTDRAIGSPPSGKSSRTPVQRVEILLAILVIVAVASVAGFILFHMVSYENCIEHAHGRGEYAQC